MYFANEHEIISAQTLANARKLVYNDNLDTVVVDVVSGIVKFNEENLMLTKKECALLLAILQTKESMATSEYLYETIWGAPPNPESFALRSAIKRLRAKIKPYGWVIEWSKANGYVFKKHK